MIKIHSLHDLHEEDILKTVIAAGEGPKLEFKRDITTLSDMAELMSSFANTDGGLILYGVDEDGQTAGITDTEQFNNLVLQASTVTQPAISGLSTGIAYLGDKTIGCILIWPGSGLPLSLDRKYFRRVGSMTVAFSGAQIDQVIKEREEPQNLFIPSREIRRFLDAADEDTLIEILLVPILRNLGFRCVSPKGHADRSLEYGQDIRGFKFQLPTGHWLYFAAQVKTGPVSYSCSDPSKNIEQILTQVRMAFRKKMFDYETNSDHVPDHVILIASGKIVEGARVYLSEQLSDIQPHILFWDRNLIIERCEEAGLAPGIQHEIHEYLKTVTQQ